MPRYLKICLLSCFIPLALIALFLAAALRPLLRPIGAPRRYAGVTLCVLSSE